MKKVRIDVPDALYAIGITLTILMVSNILPISWSSLCGYWLLSLVYVATSLFVSGIIDEVRANDKQ